MSMFMERFKKIKLHFLQNLWRKHLDPEGFYFVSLYQMPSVENLTSVLLNRG